MPFFLSGGNDRCGVGKHVAIWSRCDGQLAEELVAHRPSLPATFPRDLGGCVSLGFLEFILQRIHWTVQFHANHNFLRPVTASPKSCFGIASDAQPTSRVTWGGVCRMRPHRKRDEPEERLTIFSDDRVNSG